MLTRSVETNARRQRIYDRMAVHIRTAEETSPAWLTDRMRTDLEELRQALRLRPLPDWMVTHVDV